MVNFCLATLIRIYPYETLIGIICFYLNAVYFKCLFRSTKNISNQSLGYLQEKSLEKKA